MRVSTTKERLKEIMNERNLKKADIVRLAQPFCEKYDMKLAAPQLTQYIYDGVEPSQDKLTLLSLALNVSESWLMGLDVDKVKHIKLEDSEIDKEVYEKYLKLSARDKLVVSRMIDTMLDK